MEKSYLTKPWFKRVFTTFLGMIFTDSYLGYVYECNLTSETNDESTVIQTRTTTSLQNETDPETKVILHIYDHSNV
jgi:hypothetical protein